MERLKETEELKAKKALLKEHLEETFPLISEAGG